MRQAKEKSSVRFQADLSVKDWVILDSLKEQLDLRSNAELLAEAITIMGWVVRERSSGRFVGSFDRDKPVRELVAPFLDRAALSNVLARAEMAWNAEEVASFAKLMLADPKEPARDLVAAVKS